MNVFRQLGELPRSVRVLFAATLINRCGTMVLPYLALYITVELGAGAEAAGAVLAAYGVGAIVAPVIAGRLADRFGPLTVMRASLIGSGIILLSYPVAPRSPSALVALTFSLAFVAEGFRPASLAVVADTVPPAQRKAAFAVLRFAINLGMSIGPAVGGLLATTSFRALFYIDGVTSIAAGALLAASSRRSRSPADPISAAASPHADSAMIAAQHGPAVFARFLAGAFLLSLVFFQFESSLPLFMVREVHSTEAVYGMLIALNAIIIIFAEIPLNLKMTSWPHHRAMALGAGFCAVGFGMLAFGKNLPLVVASVPLWTLGEMIVLPATSAFVSDVAPPGRTGAYMGLFTTAFGLGFALGPIAGIYALEHLGSAALWSGAFVVGALSAAIFASVRSDAGGEGAPAPPAQHSVPPVGSQFRDRSASDG
jgi:MFS family permease